MGGPGAVFWMWLTALFGMATKFSSCTLAQLYRQRNEDGTISGGPMYYLDLGLSKKGGAWTKIGTNGNGCLSTCFASCRIPTKWILWFRFFFPAPCWILAHAEVGGLHWRMANI